MQPIQARMLPSLPFFPLTTFTIYWSVIGQVLFFFFLIFDLLLLLANPLFKMTYFSLLGG